MKPHRLTKPIDPTRLIRTEGGFLLIAGLVLLAILSLVGTAAYLISSTDIKIGGNFRNNQQAFEVAMAGTERGREVLRQANISSADPTSFNSELVAHAGANGTFELYNSGSDDVPLISATAMGNYSYTVYLSNDSVDINPPISAPTADSNNKVLITSIATGPNNAKAIVEIAVSLPPPPAPSPPPSIPSGIGTVTLLGNSQTFLGGNSNAKALNGDDQCGSASPMPVVAVSDPGSLANVQTNIANSKPATYHTKLANGTAVTGATNINAIATTITASQDSSVLSTSGVDLTSASSLNNMVSSIQAVADTVVTGNANTGSVNLGTVNSLKTVVIDGDFTMNAGSSGAGMLVVTGNLTFAGNINYTGIIMVIGKGSMTRNGGGNGTISGEIWVANTAGPDGIVGNADDTLGLSRLDTSGGGNSNIQYCSSAVHNAITNLHSPPASPSNAALIVKSFRQIL